MQLRSGKTIGPSAYKYYKENITLSRDGFSSQDKSDFSKTFSEQAQSFLQKKEWLTNRLQRYVYEVSIICPTIPTAELALCERARLISEMVYIILEEIDFITSSPIYNNVVITFIKRFYVLKTEITNNLNSSCNKFSLEDRQFLGNLRSDLVKVAVLLENRQK